MIRTIPALVALIVAGVLVGCDPAPEPAGPKPAETAAPTNRVDINAVVRQNLGITFARVETRSVERTLRVPGRFELLPTARRDYRAPVSGGVELLVEQYQSVAVGTPLYRLDAPRWREIQRELTDAEAAVLLAQAGADSIGPLMEAHEEHHTAIEHAVSLWSRRVSELGALRAAGGARGEEVTQAQAALATARSDLAEAGETHVQLTARERESRAQLGATLTRRAILLEAAASLAGVTVAELLEADGDRPRWQAIAQIEVRSLSAGIVDELLVTSGSYVDQHAPVLVTVRPEQVRFRAHALQSDLGRLADGMPAAVVAPLGGSVAGADPVAGTLTVAPTADAERRTIEVVMTPAEGAPVASWVRAGVSAFLEVVVDGAGGGQLAIPLACVGRDGTRSIIFRRDRASPDLAIRMEADLGADDGRWVVIRSGVGEGDEIVLDGVYQLMVATSGSMTRGGHFHPDGTFHEGDE